MAQLKWYLPPEKRHPVRRAKLHDGITFKLNTNVMPLPNIGLKQPRFDDVFYKGKVYVIRYCMFTVNPRADYDRLTLLFRKFNNGMFRNFPVSGYRLTNIWQAGTQGTFRGWRLIINIFCDNLRYASTIYNALAEIHPIPSDQLFVTFRRQPAAKEKYDFYNAYIPQIGSERLDCPTALARRPADQIKEIGLRQWSIKTTVLGNYVEGLLDQFAVKFITTGESYGVSISSNPKEVYDPLDFNGTDRHLLTFRLRYVQPFGRMYKYLNQ